MARSIVARVRAVATLGLVALYPWVAGAAPEHSDAAAAEHHGGFEWFTPVFGNQGKTGLAWILINFVVLMWILEKLLFSKLRARQAEKHDTVKVALERATAARTEAEALITEYRDRLDRLDGEIDELMADSKRRAEADRQGIVQAAKDEAARIREAADAAAAREAEHRKRTIENEIIDRAIAKAETLLRERFGTGDQQRRVHDYIGQLEQLEFGGPQGRAQAGG